MNTSEQLSPGEEKVCYILPRNRYPSSISKINTTSTSSQNVRDSWNSSIRKR